VATNDRAGVATRKGLFDVRRHGSASDDAGRTWSEVAAPTYAPQPGGLFRSADFGRSWPLVEPLRQRPGLLGWFGGGYPVPGIHSIGPYPAHAHVPDRALRGRAGRSVVPHHGGIWRSTDGAASWQQVTTALLSGFG
jgi:hypothetical protein